MMTDLPFPRIAFKGRRLFWETAPGIFYGSTGSEFDGSPGAGYSSIAIAMQQKGEIPAAIEAAERELSAAPIYGLLVAYRDYRCLNCGHAHKLQTNHTGPLAVRCPECSWKPSWGAAVIRAKPFAHPASERPHRYAGGPVMAHEYNPHARKAGT